MAAPVPSAPLADPALSFETPERVELSLDVAGLGTRALAYLADAFVLFLFWVTILFIVSLLRAQGISMDDFYALPSLLQALLIFGVFAVQWGYWVFFETLWVGRTPGKRLVRVRVVKLDGAPVGFSDAALRNLGRVADFLPVLYAVGLTVMIAGPRSRRLGDLLAGTLVVRERKADLSHYDAPAHPPSASALQLSAAEYELVASFLARSETLAPESRERVALKLALPLAHRLPAEKQAAALANGPAAEAFLKSLVSGDG
jgi:uncharacterized RDD family membrane protein YckC